MHVLEHLSSSHAGIYFVYRHLFPVWDTVPDMSTEIGEALNAAVQAELRAERSRQQMDYGDLAKEAGMSRSSAHRYLNKSGLAVPLTALVDLCAALNMDPLEVLSEAQKRAQ